MRIETIDLYDYFRIKRNGCNGGILTAYVRNESTELIKRTRPAVIVLERGAYCGLSDREGEPVALEFLHDGFCAFELKYSVKREYPGPLIEAMLAVLYVRENVDKYSLDENKLCVVGFSAGAHLAGLLATVTDAEAHFIDKDVSRIKPNAAILSYPVVTMGEYTHECSREVISGGDKSLFDALSVEKRVNKDTPPLFVWHTYEDSCVPVENSVMLFEACRRNRVPMSLHIFERGEHGLSLADYETCDLFGDDRSLYSYLNKWYGLAIDWLRLRGFLIVK